MPFELSGQQSSAAGGSNKPFEMQFESSELQPIPAISELNESIEEEIPLKSSKLQPSAASGTDESIGKELPSESSTVAIVQPTRSIETISVSRKY